MARATLNNLIVDKYLIELKPLLSDIDSENSGRSVSGRLMRDRIATKRKYQLSFCPMTYAEAKAIIQAVSPVFFNAVFEDPLVGAITLQCYATDRSWEEIPSLPGYIKGLSFSLVER